MKRILVLIIIGISLLSCEDFLEVGSNSSELDTDLVFSTEQTALGALGAIYHELQRTGFSSGNTSSFTFLSNTLTDDAKEHSITSNRYDFYTNTLRADNGLNNEIWTSLYTSIYRLNALLEGVENNTTLPTEVIVRIQGEAKFVRAFIYYYLVHLYGEAPLVLSTDYKINQSLSRSPVTAVYEQITQDLLEAVEVLPENYENAEGQHIRPTQYAAYTLLARMALWEKEYEKAISYADRVIDAGVYRLTDLDAVFLSNSSESIWQLIPVDPNRGTHEGYAYILENNPSTLNAASTLSLTEDFLRIWENDDLRLSHWINVYTEDSTDYHYPFKYKIKNGGDTEEYSMVLRLGELYLIRAEAYARTGKVKEALTNLNRLRNRAGLQNLISSEVTDIEQSVLEERRRELFSEWGHRWLDLKRFGKLDGVLEAKKSTWQSHAQLLPIPEQELKRNPSLTQNPGY